MKFPNFFDWLILISFFVVSASIPDSGILSFISSKATEWVGEDNYLSWSLGLTLQGLMFGSFLLLLLLYLSIRIGDKNILLQFIFPIIACGVFAPVIFLLLAFSYVVLAVVINVVIFGYLFYVLWEAIRGD